ncbi:hypothetical protein DBR32_15375 [Taibaiella sp. KBW10]|uniref:pyridoxamine 5'-phosphate oxidase family protein n=1 Tax=Taibaiella sp. KBW10 TaxID=2153357 RepID=UPI000F5A513D|nr:pyridoxamine 5'-phosphate oxidase family protein [Taibaiella sp. KBW10]RQO29637.1 hypothetical protein DBR32_15375 [Taibaiella sp. KBW10]
MEPINEDIALFISGQTCATICCIDEQNRPYCFTCFYVYDKSKQCLYFKSSANTHHISLLLANGICAGTILEDNLDKILVKGIQLEGHAVKNTLFDLAPAMQYHATFPMAVAVPGDMWTLSINTIKFTDNSKGFGSKFHWDRTSS